MVQAEAQQERNPGPRLTACPCAAGSVAGGRRPRCSQHVASAASGASQAARNRSCSLLLPPPSLRSPGRSSVGLGGLGGDPFERPFCPVKAWCLVADPWPRGGGRGCGLRRGQSGTQPQKWGAPARPPAGSTALVNVFSFGLVSQGARGATWGHSHTACACFAANFTPPPTTKERMKGNTGTLFGEGVCSTRQPRVGKQPRGTGPAASVMASGAAWSLLAVWPGQFAVLAGAWLLPCAMTTVKLSRKVSVRAGGSRTGVAALRVLGAPSPARDGDRRPKCTQSDSRVCL